MSINHIFLARAWLLDLITSWPSITALNSRCALCALIWGVTIIPAWNLVTHRDVQQIKWECARQRLLSSVGLRVLCLSQTRSHTQQLAMAFTIMWFVSPLLPAMALLQPSGDTCLGGTYAKIRDQVLLAPPPLSQRYDLTLNERCLHTRVVFRRTKDFKVQTSFSLMAQICKYSCNLIFEEHEKISALTPPG